LTVAEWVCAGWRVWRLSSKQGTRQLSDNVMEPWQLPLGPQCALACQWCCALRETGWAA
jgi:hypothetical protein